MWTRRRMCFPLVCLYSVILQGCIYQPLLSGLFVSSSVSNLNHCRNTTHKLLIHTSFILLWQHVKGHLGTGCQWGCTKADLMIQFNSFTLQTTAFEITSKAIHLKEFQALHSIPLFFSAPGSVENLFMLSLITVCFRINWLHRATTIFY